MKNDKPAKVKPRSSFLVHEPTRELMEQLEEVWDGQVAAAEDEAAAGRVSQVGHEMLNRLMAALEQTPAEQKARQQQRWDMGQRPDEPCTVCFYPSAQSRAPGAGAHAALTHQVAEERASDGYEPCGCVDGGGPCVRNREHVGPCAIEWDSNPSYFSQPYSPFVCRGDDSEPHPTV